MIFPGNLKPINLGKISIEFLLLIAGVYLAFQMENWRESIQQNKVKQSYYALMLNEFKFNLAEVKQAKQLVEARLKIFSQLGHDNSTQAFAPLDEIDLTSNMLVLKAAFNSGHLENLNTGYVSRLSLGSNALLRVARKIDFYNHRISQVLTRVQYQYGLLLDANGQLQTQFGWILAELTTIDEYLGMLIVAIEQGAIKETEKLLENNLA